MLRLYFYKLSGQILTLCEADGTVRGDAVRRTLHEVETPEAVALELARELREQRRRGFGRDLVYPTPPPLL